MAGPVAWECVELDMPVVLVPDGEACKSLETLEKVWQQLFDLKCDRSSRLVGVGGGSCCDLTGFAAATFGATLRMCSRPRRGSSRGQYPTGEGDGASDLDEA